MEDMQQADFAVLSDDKEGNSQPSQQNQDLEMQEEIKQCDEAQTFKTDISSRQLICGMRNLGNTCYMNSVVQCLLNTQELIDEIMTKKEIQSPILKELKNLIVVMNEENKKVSASSKSVQAGWFLAPQEFVKSVKQELFEFNNYHQQDAHSFMISLFESAEMQKIQANCFQGKQKQIFTCPVQHKDHQPQEIIQNEAFFSLQLPLQPEKVLVDQLSCCCGLYSKNQQEGEPNITKMLEESQKVDYLDNWECLTCHVQSPKFQQQTLNQEYNRNLIIHLMRFTFAPKQQKIVKNKIRLEVEQVIFLKPANGQEESETYYLQSVVCHLGDLNSGHYYAYCLKNSWYLFDDSVVTQIHNTEKMMKDVCKNAYILLYRKVDP